jgi:sugar phosphate permease
MIHNTRHTDGSDQQQPWFVSGGVPNRKGPSTDHHHDRANPIAPRQQRKSVIVATCFLATFLAYIERTGFSVAFTAAARDQKLDEAVKGAVLSSFFWGYALSQVLHMAFPGS